MSKLLKLFLAATLSFVSFSACADYTFTLLDGLGGSGMDVFARSINNLGQIVGTSYFAAGNAKATFWDSTSPSTPTLLESLGGTSTGGFAIAINDSGQIAGTSYLIPSGNFSRATLWSTAAPSAPTQLENLGGGSSPYGYAFAINNSGKIVGYSYNANNTMEATLWDSTNPSAPTQLQSLSQYAYAMGINSSGQIVGDSRINNGLVTATLWDSTNPSAPTQLQSLGGVGVNGNANAINNLGQIVGSSYNASGTYVATLWNSTDPSAPIELESLGAPGPYGYSDPTYKSSAVAINNLGKIVGISRNASGINRATLWDGGKAIDLNTYLDSASADAGWEITVATSINDNGSIVGIASNSLLGLTNQAFLLSYVAAVPELNTNVMLLIGLGLFSFIARRQKKQYQLTSQAITKF